jgi:hypothetical protein
MSKYHDFRPVDLTITPDTVAYTANDVIGGLLTLSMNTTRGKIYGVTVGENENIAIPGAIWLFDSTPTSFDDNAAFAPVFADHQKLVGILTLPTAVAVNSLNIYNLVQNDKPILYWTDKLYAYFVTSGTPGFGASKSISIRFYVMGEK